MAITLFLGGLYQGSEYRTVLAGMAGIYRISQYTGTSTTPISYRKKYRQYWTRTGHTGEIRLFRPVNGYRPEQKAVDLNAQNDPKTLSINVLVCETRERERERSRSWLAVTKFSSSWPHSGDNEAGWR